LRVFFTCFSDINKKSYFKLFHDSTTLLWKNYMLNPE
jgi:hypothetical protein